MQKEVKLKIESLDIVGAGVAKLNNKVVFVENALPGEDVIATIEKEQSKVIFAKTKKVLNPNNEIRNYELCPHFEECGGCNIMHLKYEEQLKFKHNKVKNTLKNIAGIETIVNDTIKADNVFNYRNKCIVPFAYDGSEVIYGFYKKLSHDVVKRNKCLIEPEIFSDILEMCKEYFVENEISIYDEKLHKGSIRNVMLRITKNNEIMLVIIVNEINPTIKYLAIKLVGKNLVHSAYLNVNDKKTNVVLSDKFIHLAGSETITEEILGLKFNVSASTFLQVNHDQCEKLYTKVLEYANVTKEDNVIDAYCGMGSISLNLAKNAKHVYGIEVVESAIINANKNKELNNITNATFICGKCEDEIVKLVNKEKIDVIVFDPPRKGCAKEFLDTVIKMNIPRIVYVSCDIATCARDLKYLSEYGYEVVEATPTDLFPQSFHVECVTMLCRNAKK